MNINESKMQKNMLVTKNKKTKKSVLIIAIASLLVLATPFVYVYALNGSILGWEKSTPTTESTPAINYDEPTKEQIDSGNAIKEGTDPAVDTAKGEDDTTAPTPLPSGKYTATVTIINAGSKDADGNVNVRASIDAIDSAAECTLNILSQSGAILVTQKANTQAQSSYSSCLGFTISSTELPAGTYTTKITYTSATHEGTASANFKL